MIYVPVQIQDLVVYISLSRVVLYSVHGSESEFIVTADLNQHRHAVGTFSLHRYVPTATRFQNSKKSVSI